MSKMSGRRGLIALAMVAGSLAVGTAPAVDAAGPCTSFTTVPAGVADNFDTANGAEPTSPSADVVAYHAGAIAHRDFDESGINAYFEHTFTGLTAPAGEQICGAVLTTRIANGDSNDNFNIEQVGPGPTLVSGGIYSAPLTFLGVAVDATGDITLDLGALVSDGIGADKLDFIAEIEQNGFLDIVVQDDSAVDYLALELFTQTVYDGTLDFTKVVNGETEIEVPAETPLTWTYTFTNNTEHPASPQSLLDDPEGEINLDHCEGISGTIQPGESFTCALTGFAGYEPYCNTATVSVVLDGVEGYEGGLPASESATSCYTPIVPEELTGTLSITKTTNGAVAAGQVPVGDPITWTYVVTNNTNVPLASVRVTDDKEGTIPAGNCTAPAPFLPGAPVTTMYPGQTITCTLTGTAQAGSYTNQAAARGTSTLFGSVVSATVTSSYTGGESPTVCQTGLNVLFVVDNSGSISAAEYDDFITTADKVGNELLKLTTGGASVEIAAAHYNAQQVHIERDFSPAPVSLLTTRPLTQGDDLGDAMRVLRDSLTGVVNPKLTSSSVVKTFSYDQTAKTHIVVFTDGYFDLSGGPGRSVLKDRTGATPYEIYDELKTDQKVSFTVVHVDSPLGNPMLQQQAAAIASPGGQYTGIVASNPTDPFAGASPRRYWTGTFDLTDIADDIAADITTDCALTVDKRTNGSNGTPTIIAGTPVTWTYEVTNNSTQPVTAITVTDDVEGVICTVVTLAPGASTTCNKVGIAVPGVYANTATVVGTIAGFTATAIDSSGYRGRRRRPLVGVVPGRLLETRVGPDFATTDGESLGGGMTAAGGVVTVQVGGRGNVPADATAAVLNVTAIAPAGRGYLTLYPCTRDVPTASTVNFVPGRNVANAINVKLSASGTVCIFTSNSTHVALDVGGYAPAESDLGSIDPARYLDTRGPSDAFPEFDCCDDDDDRGPRGIIIGGQDRVVQIAGRGDVPTGAAAAMVNVTAVAATGRGYLTLFPCGEDVPNASTLNFVPGANVANATTVKLSAEGTVCVFASTTTHVVLDVVGFVPEGSALGTVVPARLLETRSGEGVATVDGESLGAGRTEAGEIVRVQVAGRGEVPEGATAAVLNVTAVGAPGRGYVTLYPCTAKVPNASTLNFVPGINSANATTVSLTASGEVCIFTSSPTHLLLDVAGYVYTEDTVEDILE